MRFLSTLPKTHLRADEHGWPLAGPLLAVVALLRGPVAVLLVVGGDGALLVIRLDRVGLPQAWLRNRDRHLGSLNLSHLKKMSQI